MVHRLVAIAFIGNPQKGQEVNHIDGNKGNNAVENLEWVSKSENQQHRYKDLKWFDEKQIQGFRNENEKRKQIRLRVSDDLLHSSMPLKQVSQITGVSIATISRMRNGK